MEFQWLARYWAPDCSHSHIMRPGGILIILIILLVHFTTSNKTICRVRFNKFLDVSWHPEGPGMVQEGPGDFLTISTKTKMFEKITS